MTLRPIAFLIRRAPAQTGPAAFLIRTEFNLCHCGVARCRARCDTATDTRRRRMLLGAIGRDRIG